MINGTVANLALNPTKTKTAHATSAKIANPKEISGPSPKGSANRIGPSARNLPILGIPWVSIIPPAPILIAKAARSGYVELVIRFGFEWIWSILKKKWMIFNQ
jgi:hypothetical protein